MGRAERRRQAKQEQKQARQIAYTLTKEQLDSYKEQVKQEAIKEAYETLKDAVTIEVTQDAMVEVLGLPIIVIRDHFKDLIKLEVNGLNRAQRFTDYLLEYYNDDNVTLDIIKQALWEEAGISLAKAPEEEQEDTHGN